MADITEYLEQIENAVYGKDVRQAIHDGIEQCYEDGKAGAIDLTARNQIANVNSDLQTSKTSLQNQIDEIVAPEGDPSLTEVANARIDAEGTTHATLKERCDADAEKVSDLRSALRDLAATKNASNFTWTIGKNINNTGAIVTAGGIAMSSKEDIESGTTIINIIPTIGYEGKTSTLWINQFLTTDGTWKNRTEVPYGGFFKVSDDCNKIIYCYGYTGSQAVVMTQDIVNNEFHIKETRECATKEYVDKRSSYDENVNLESGLYSGSPVVGQLVNLTETVNANWERAKIQVNTGDKIIYKGKSTSNTKLLTVTDVNDIVIYTSDSYNVESDETYVCNADGLVYYSAQISVSHSLTLRHDNGLSYVLNKSISESEAYTDSKETVLFPIDFNFDASNIPLQADGSYDDYDLDDIYGLYDALMAQYPDYITKVDCATSGIIAPQYMTGLSMYLYKFTPSITNNQFDSTKIKLMVLTGTHANEEWNIFNVYQLLKYVCEQYAQDKNAMTLRTLVEIWIIPMVNPYGFANGNGRVNGNGVNLNRNAPTANWEYSGYGTTNYSGESAGSEYETKIWLYYFNQFKPDVFIDQHTPNMTDTGSFGTMLVSEDKAVTNVISVMAREYANNLHRLDANVPTSINKALFNAQIDNHTGTVAECAHEQGTRFSATFEMAYNSKWNNGVLDDATVTPPSSGLMKQEQMQNIYLGWMYMLKCASNRIVR